MKKTIQMKVDDNRIMRPRIVRDELRNLDLTLQPWETIQIDEAQLSFASPNNITIFVSIADRERKVAASIYEKIIASKISRKETYIFEKNDLSELYNYFEHIQMSIIAIFTAIEALANVAIPDDYSIEKINAKKIKEIWTKESIERWSSTLDKIGDIVPEILKIESPKNLKIWSNFKELESIRNDIIHQKTTKEKAQDMDSKLLKKLLSNKIFSQIHAGFTMIKYYCESDKSHYFFPLGFGEAKFESLKVDDVNKAFKKIN